MATPNFNTFRKINYNNPQYQQAMLDKQNASDYSVNPNTRAITDSYTKSEANRIRGLDEFGIANRMADEQRAFASDMQNSRMNLAYQKIADERQAMKDSKKGRDLGMMIGLAQGGMNMYDNTIERGLREQAAMAQQAEMDAMTREIADRTTAPAQGIAFDPSLDHKRLTGRVYY